MGSGNQINENQLGEEDMATESDTHAAFSVPFSALAGFPVDFLFGSDNDSKCEAPNF